MKKKHKIRILEHWG